MRYCGNKMDVARFVAEVLVLSNPVYVSITITSRGSSAVSYVSFVTDTSSVDIVKKVVQTYLERHTNTSLQSIPV
jgi:hypothetical protein